MNTLCLRAILLFGAIRAAQADIASTLSGMPYARFLYKGALLPPETAS
jgi:hypothetical protein